MDGHREVARARESFCLILISLHAILRCRHATPYTLDLKRVQMIDSYLSVTSVGAYEL